MNLSMYVELERARELRRAHDPACVRAYGRVAALARTAGDGETLYHAQAGIGRFYRTDGEAGRALPWYERARRTAEDGSLRRWLAPSIHDLFVTHFMAGDRKTGMLLACEALETYPDHHPRRFALIHDIYVARMETGNPESEIFRAACVYVAGTPELGIVQANLLRAFGMEHRNRRFCEVLPVFEPTGEMAAVCLLEAARGARAAGFDALAEEMLQRTEALPMCPSARAAVNAERARTGEVQARTSD